LNIKNAGGCIVSITHSIHLHLNNTSLQWGIAWEYANANNNYCLIEAQIGIPIYKSDDAWQGVNLFRKNCVRKRNPVPSSTSINNN
jgi:hypothetical protein